MAQISESQIPQADRLEDVINTVIAVSEGKTTDADISLGKDPRQGRYYRKAAENLGFITNEKNRSQLTSAGRTFLKLSKDEQKQKLIEILKHDPFFQEFFVHFAGITFTRDDAVRFIASVIEEKRSTETIRRRFSSVKAWLISLELLKEENEYFTIENLSLEAVNLPESEETYTEESNLSDTDSTLPEGKLPRPEQGTRGESRVWKRNPKRAKMALSQAGYLCTIDLNHRTFTHKKTGNQYMEPHHLVPMQFQGQIDADIDVPENIVSLCPTCHECVHRAEDSERKQILLGLLEKRAPKLQERGIETTVEELLGMYGIE